MRVCFVENLGGLEKGETSGAVKNKTEELTLAGFSAQEICYEKELKGESRFFEQAARVSKLHKNLVVCGCVTNTHGHRRKSALVAENGRILGVSDATHAIDGEVSSGANLRVYETKIGRVGVVVAEDLYFSEVLHSLAVCGSEWIVCICDGGVDCIHSALLRAGAFENGVPILFCAKGYCMVVGANGDLRLASPNLPICAEIKKEKEYHLVETRRRFFRRK
ncbi:MAG: hypothetical protein IJV83_01865 [Clostridia bacterium]|nr:hypothetical protein [Clostridia bacterium]